MADAIDNLLTIMNPSVGLMAIPSTSPAGTDDNPNATVDTTNVLIQMNDKSGQPITALGPDPSAPQITEECMDQDPPDQPDALPAPPTNQMVQDQSDVYDKADPQDIEQVLAALDMEISQKHHKYLTDKEQENVEAMQTTGTP